MVAFQFPVILTKLKHKESWVLYISMFIMGACGLAYEYTLSKVAGDILGNSVRQWAIIIGVMMFFMGVGADLQKYIDDMYILDLFILFEIIVGVTGAFGPIAFIYFYGHFPLQFVLVKYFFIILIGLIIGLEIPLITRINEQFIIKLKLNLAAVLKMDYIGSLAGALAWIFLLPLFFEQVQAAFVLGALNISVAAFTLIFFKKMLKLRFLLIFSILIAASAVVTGYLKATEWRVYSEQYLYRDLVVYSETTRYQHIVITKSRANDISCYINGHLQFNSADEYIYHEDLVHPAFAVAPYHQNILILGGGDGLALREVLKYQDVHRVVLCDIDPVMTTLAKENGFINLLNNNSLKNSKVDILENNALLPADSTNIYISNKNVFHDREQGKVATVEIINLDATAFVEQFSGFFDIIILDFPDPNAPELCKLYSEQFYQNLSGKLSADGIIVQQATSPYHAREVFLCIGRTLEESGFSIIPYKDNVPSFGEWGWWIAGKSDRYSSATFLQKFSTIDRISVETRYLSAEVLKSLFIFGKDQLKTEETAVNTLANNVIFQYYLESWK
jgi:spermidine synthase